jgi:hypothetical protein
LLEWFKRKNENNEKHSSREITMYVPPNEPKPANEKIRWIEIYPKMLRTEPSSSSAILKDGFCCDNSNGQLVAFNHVAALFACKEKHCRKKLVKIPLMEVLA